MPKFLLHRDKVDIPPNPTIELAERVLKEAMDFGATEIESKGGGSTIDVGKFVAWKMGVPHTAIPTTAGTGSEVTKYAVFIKDGKKFSLCDEKLIPTNFILEPNNLIGLPKEVAISSGLDALSQCIESYWSPKATKESRIYSKQGIGLIMDNLYPLVFNPDRSSRLGMLRGANLSGRAINITGTSICHAISYPLTTLYGIPHGVACAYTLPYFMRKFNVNCEDSDRIDMLISLLVDFIKVDAEKVADMALEYENAKNVPTEVTKEDILKSLNKE